MGKRLEMSIYHGVVQFLTSPGIPYVVSGNFFEFAIFHEVLNLFEENEEETDNIVGYEVLDINTIEESDIPDIDEKYDVVDTEFKDMTIKEIVLAVQKVFKEKQKPDEKKVA